MACIHYKFSSKLDYNTVIFDGLYITLGELKRQIVVLEHLKARNCDLQITDGHTQEEFTDDEAYIPKYSSVIVRRTPPVGGVKPAARKFIVDRSDTAVVGSSRPMANLVDANASEEDKIKAMMSQSNHGYNPTHYSKMAVGPPPAHYTCYRCGKAGHYFGQCRPMLADKSVEGSKPVRISKGIPQCFMVKTEPGTKGAMLTSTGEYAIPAIDAKAYAQRKKEQPRFVPHDQSSSKDDTDPIPDQLLCPICNDMMTDAVVTPCCGKSYCDDCIRTALLDSEEHICFSCQRSEVSPDDLAANNFLRQVINNFKNETGYTKHGRKQQQKVAPPPPWPQLVRPLHLGQRDLLMASITPPPSMSVPMPALQAQAPPFPPPALYALPPQPYLPPYTSGPGLVPPPCLSYQPQPVYAPGAPGLNPPLLPPGVQYPLLPPSPCLQQPPFFVLSRLDEFKKDFHNEHMEYRNEPQQRRPSYSRPSHRPPFPSDGRRMEEGHSLLGPPPAKLRRIAGLGTGRKERSASEDRTVSRERLNSAGERQHGSDRDQDRRSGPDRNRVRPSGSDRGRNRDRDRGQGSDRNRDRPSRPIHLTDHQDKSCTSWKERGDPSERAAKSDRSDRTRTEQRGVCPPERNQLLLTETGPKTDRKPL